MCHLKVLSYGEHIMMNIMQEKKRTLIKEGPQKTIRLISLPKSYQKWKLSEKQ